MFPEEEGWCSVKMRFNKIVRIGNREVGHGRMAFEDWKGKVRYR